MTSTAKNTNQNTGFGVRLRELRNERGLTQIDLADMIGSTEVSIQKYESGERFGRPDTHAKLASALGVNVEYLVYGNTAGDSNPTVELAEINELALQLPRMYQLLLRDFAKLLLKGYLYSKNEASKVIGSIDQYPRRKTK